MTDFLFFLGRFHVLLLHLPIGILGLAVVLEIASRRERFRNLAPALNAVWLLGALSAIATAALGYLHAREGGFDAAAINAHRIAGTSLAVVATAIWLVRAKLAGVYAKAWPVGSLVVVALLIVTGHLGGNLTHGDIYLAQYAPAPLRHIMGVSDESMPRARPKDVASADVYLDVVAPALQQRCSGCHNDGKRKGGLSLAGYNKLMNGGEHGPVIVPGDAKASELVRRISLPPDDKDFMPHDGKTPLTAEQTAAIRWWVVVGAPRSAQVVVLKPPADVRASLEAALGFAKPVPDTMQVAAATPAADVPPPDSTVVNALENAGFVVRAIAVESPLVQVDYTASKPVSDADLALLAKIGRQVYTLNLRGAGITDAQLKGLSGFDHLARLRLELNPISNAGVATLGALSSLEYLNLYGTQVGDAGLAALGRLPKLHELFVWQTAITPASIATYRQAHAGTRIEGGFDPKTFPEGPKVIPVVN